jgi:hypothetical protein
MLALFVSHLALTPVPDESLAIRSDSAGRARSRLEQTAPPEIFPQRHRNPFRPPRAAPIRRGPAEAAPVQIPAPPPCGTPVRPRRGWIHLGARREVGIWHCLSDNSLGCRNLLFEEASWTHLLGGWPAAASSALQLCSTDHDQTAKYARAESVKPTCIIPSLSFSPLSHSN